MKSSIATVTICICLLSFIRLTVQARGDTSVDAQAQGTGAGNIATISKSPDPYAAVVLTKDVTLEYNYALSAEDILSSVIWSRGIPPRQDMMDWDGEQYTVYPAFEGKINTIPSDYNGAVQIFNVNQADIDAGPYVMSLNYRNSAGTPKSELSTKTTFYADVIKGTARLITPDGGSDPVNVTTNITAASDVKITVFKDIKITHISGDLILKKIILEYPEGNVSFPCDYDASQCPVRAGDPCIATVKDGTAPPMHLDFGIDDSVNKEAFAHPFKTSRPPWNVPSGNACIAISCVCLLLEIIVVTALAVTKTLTKKIMWIIFGVCCGVTLTCFVWMPISVPNRHQINPDLYKLYLTRSLPVCAACVVGEVIVAVVTYFFYDWRRKPGHSKSFSDTPMTPF